MIPERSTSIICRFQSISKIISLHAYSSCMLVWTMSFTRIQTVSHLLFWCIRSYQRIKVSVLFFGKFQRNLSPFQWVSSNVKDSDSFCTLCRPCERGPSFTSRKLPRLIVHSLIPRCQAHLPNVRRSSQDFVALLRTVRRKSLTELHPLLSKHQRPNPSRNGSGARAISQHIFWMVQFTLTCLFVLRSMNKMKRTIFVAEACHDFSKWSSTLTPSIVLIAKAFPKGTQLK